MFLLKNHVTSLQLTIYALLMAVLLSGCGSDKQTYKLQGKTMGTQYNISIVSLEKLDVQTLQRAIDEKLASINQQMSTYIDHSELSRFNQASSTDWFEVSPSLVKVVETALMVSQQSDGAFDATVFPLIKRWGFGSAFRLDIPTDEELAQQKTKIGYQFIQNRAEPPALKKNKPGIMLDLSAIAKGYAVDQITEHLNQQGFHNHLVEIGGEVRATGLSARQQPWQIGIEKPLHHQRSQLIGIPLMNESVATSGDYRNYFEHEGKRYSHTIDPKTAKPVTHQLASVTVIHPENMWADAYATAIMVLGKEQGLILAEELKLPVYLLSHQEGGRLEESYSKAFKKYLPNQ
jgi:thiamine biosynthesis lipoprotein